jgi:hypothetical protein
MEEYYSSEDIRNIIDNAHKIKEKNKCKTCNTTGFVNWNDEIGGDVKPGRLSKYYSNRAESECEKCGGIGYVDILMY